MTWSSFERFTTKHKKSDRKCSLGQLSRDIIMKLCNILLNVLTDMLHTERNAKRGKLSGITYYRKQQTCIWAGPTVKPVRMWREKNTQSQRNFICCTNETEWLRSELCAVRSWYTVLSSFLLFEKAGTLKIQKIWVIFCFRLSINEIFDLVGCYSTWHS